MQRQGVVYVWERPLCALPRRLILTSQNIKYLYVSCQRISAVQISADLCHFEFECVIVRITNYRFCIKNQNDKIVQKCFHSLH